MGIETLTFATSPDDQSLPLDGKLLRKEAELMDHSDALEKIAKRFESDPKFNGVLVERKYTSDSKILAGIMIDWRRIGNWDKYKKDVHRGSSATVTNLSVA